MVAALTQLRVWGLGVNAAATEDEIVALALDAGFVDVRTELVGRRTIAPALRFARDRLDRTHGEVPRTYDLAVRFLLSQVDVIWQHGMIDYLLLRATKPEG